MEAYNRLLIGLIALMFCGVNSVASEGFHSKNVPASAQRAWEATMSVSHILGPDAVNDLGTVFVSKKEKINGGYFLQLSTAGHVVGLINSGLRSPRGDVYFFSDRLKKKYFGYVTVDEGMTFGELSRVAESESLKLFVLDRRSRQFPDVGALLVEVNKATFDSIEAIPFAENCRLSNRRGASMVAVGFPYVNLRSPEVKDVRKRWTQGFFTGEEFRNRVFGGLTSTADGLEHISGGPVVNRKGQVSGTIIGRLGKDEEYRYHGSTVEEEEDGVFHPHSVIASCRDTRRYADEFWRTMTQELRSGP